MRLRHLALPAAAGLALLALPFAPLAQAAPNACNPTPNACTAEFRTSGAPVPFTVPAGVTELVVALAGGSGGGGHPRETDDGPTTTGGAGGAVIVHVPVTPGETLTVVAGGQGADATGDVSETAAGGYGGGGDGTSVSGGSDGAGGGGSFLFRGAAVVAAVGGGGGGGFDDGGDGGAGGPGDDGAAGTSDLGGGGATTTAPGAAGAGEGGQAGTGPASGPSTFGSGGQGQPVDETLTCPAGGGGGGYYGGGAGGCRFAQQGKAATLAVDDPNLGDYGAGGGGSGYLAPGVRSVATGTNTGDGTVLIGYQAAGETPTTTTLTADDTVLAPGQETDLTATVTGAPVALPTDAGSPAGTAVALTLQRDAPGIVFRPSTGVAGRAVVVTPGTACGTSACTVTFLVNGTALGDPIAVDPATGTAKVVFTAGSELGVREITARYDGAAVYAPSTSAPVAVTVSGLADTGPSNVAPMVGTSAALLVLGAGLVVAGRRRPGAHRAV